MNEYRFREWFRKYQVQADDLADFLKRYYKPARYTGRGAEYAVAVLASHQMDLDRDGFDMISQHESVTGEVVSYYPEEVER